MGGASRKPLFYRFGSSILLAFVMFVVLPIYGMIGYNYVVISNLLHATLATNNRVVMEQSKQYVEETISRINMIANMMRKDSRLLSVDSISNERMIVTLNRYFESMRVFASEMCEITVVYSDGRLFSTLPDSSLNGERIRNSAWLSEARQNLTHYRWRTLSEDFSLETENDWVALTWLFKEEGSQGKESSVILISLRPETLLKCGEDENDLLLLADEDDRPISHVAGNDMASAVRQYKNARGEIVRDSKGSYLVDAQPVIYTNWHIIHARNYSAYLRDATDQRLRVLALPLICTTGFFILTLLALRRTTKPIYNLIDASKKVESGNYSIRLPYTVKSELEIVYSAFNSMLDTFENLLHEIREKQERLLSEQRKKDDYRFKMLQSQITPHFLMNVMNNIKWMAIINQDDNVADMLAALGDLLHASMSKTDDEISVEKEMELVREYIALQKMRYGDRFEAHVVLEAGVEQYAVLKLLLQPIVENAIVHGAVQSAGNTTIQIRAGLEGDRLVLSVTDDGPGMAREQIQRLSQQEKGTLPAPSEKHIGLYGTNDRIRFYYGAEYGISVDSVPGQGTTVRLVIPRRPYREGGSQTPSHSED